MMSFSYGSGTGLSQDYGSDSMVIHNIEIIKGIFSFWSKVSERAVGCWKELTLWLQSHGEQEQAESNQRDRSSSLF